ncbi:MAG: hypothetical protein QM736_27835 [Vicinamibacterales bacterium]
MAVAASWFMPAQHPLFAASFFAVSAFMFAQQLIPALPAFASLWFIIIEQPPASAFAIGAEPP